MAVDCEVDLFVAARFLDFMAEGERVAFQTFDDSEQHRPQLAQIHHGDVGTCGRALRDLNAQGAGVYWMVNYGDGLGRRAENVTGVRCLFLDLDGAPVQPVLDAGVDPHAIVESSPGKWHVYWQVTGCQLEQFKPAQQALASRFGGDPSVCDLPRVLRVPGFLHCKSDPIAVRLERLEPLQPYRFDDLVQRLKIDLSAPAPKAMQAPRIDAETGEILGKVAPGGRHAHLVKWAAQLNFRGMPAEAVRVALQAENERACDPPKSPAEVEAIARDILSRYAGQHGRDLMCAKVGPPLLRQIGDEDCDDLPDLHRNAPRPDSACLYGLVGEVAQAGSDTTEANPFAVALNFIAYLSAAVGRGPYMPVGNTWHHARIFGQHVGRTGRGRKGDAVGIVHRIDKALRALDEHIAPQVHRGGLSSREGLVMLIHDGFTEGKNEVEPIHDKRLWVVESEFSNVLQQSKRDGNTLSAALRDVWDGVSLKPATKSNRVWASNPHIALSVAITPGELRALMASRELTNGFANRFVMIWAERTKVLPFPQATPQQTIDSLASKVLEVLKFAGADRYVDRDVKRMTLTPAAAKRYATLYTGELDDQSAGELVNALLERRAPVLLRLAMLFALTDLTLEIDTHHIEAALAWVHYWCDSAKFVFSNAVDEAGAEETNHTAARIVEYLSTKAKATRSQLTLECFQGHQSKTQIDAAIDELLSATPPRIVVETVPRAKSAPGSPTKFYSLAAKCANSAKREQWRGSGHDSPSCEVSETSELSARQLAQFARLAK